MTEWISILVLLGLAWFWLDSQRVREIALLAAKRFCDQQGLQFLDDTVATSQLRLQRNAQQRLVLARTYRFEFSDTGDNRLLGTVLMLGNQVGPMHLPNYHRAE